MKFHRSPSSSLQVTTFAALWQTFRYPTVLPKCTSLRTKCFPIEENRKWGVGSGFLGDQGAQSWRNALDHISYLTDCRDWSTRRLSITYTQPQNQCRCNPTIARERKKVNIHCLQCISNIYSITACMKGYNLPLPSITPHRCPITGTFYSAV